MRYIVFALLSLALSSVGTVLLVNSGIFHDWIEAKMRAQTGVRVELGRMRVPFQWPPTLLIQETRLPSQFLRVEFKSALFTLGSIFSPYDIRVYLREPKVVIQGEMGSLAVAPSSAHPSSAGGGGNPAPVRIRLVVADGEIRADDLTVSKLNVEFTQKLWMKTPAQLKASARIRSQLLPGEFPVAVETDSLAFSEESVKAVGVKASFAGLNAVVQGTSLFKDGRHRWVAEVKAPDLSRVPAPFELPATEWQGAVEVNAEITKESSSRPWSADARGLFKNVRARVKYSHPKGMVEGLAVLDFEGKFTYLDEKISIQALSGALDLSGAHVVSPGLLNKNPGTPLRVSMEARGNTDQLEIKKLEAELWQIKALAAGLVRLKPPFNAQLTLDVPPTSLKGIDSVFTPFKDSTVEGELAVQGAWDGPATDPWSAKIAIKSLRLKNFSAGVEYDTGGALKAKGPVRASLEATGDVDRGVPKNFQASGNLQLTNVALVAGPLRKESGQGLAAAFKLRGEGTALQLDQFLLTGFLGQVGASGVVSEPIKPKLNLRLDLKGLDLAQMRMALPEYHDLIPKGVVSGQMTLVGMVDRNASWATWPLAVGGNVKAQFSEYKWVSQPTSAPGTSTPPAAVGPARAEGFLPKGRLTESLNLQTALSVGVLTKDSLVAKGVEVAGRIQGGKFVGGGTAAEVFGGRVAVTNAEVPLLDPAPVIHGDVILNQIVIQDALAFVKPEYKTLATGRMSGPTSFGMHLPSDPKFMDTLQAKGKLKLDPVTLNTLKVGQILNDLAKKIPMLKLPPAKVEPLKGMVQADFNVESQAVTLSPLYARDQDGSELELRGKVALPTMQGDLAGNFFWVNPQVKGCLLQGNADDKGRMVVPLSLKGNLMQPEMSMLSDTVNKLAGRALECEKSKLVEQVKKDGGKKLEQEAKKVLKNILGK